MFYRVRYHLARLLAIAICEPQLRLGKRRHDNNCDRCGEHCGRYAAQKLDFPIESLEADVTSSLEKLQAMVNAEYVRVCLECSIDLEDGDSTRTEGGEQA